MNRLDEHALKQWWKANGFPFGATQLIDQHQLEVPFQEIYGECSKKYFQQHPNLQYGLAFFDEFSALMENPIKPLPFLGATPSPILSQQAYRFWQDIGFSNIKDFVARYNLHQYAQHVLDGWTLEEVLSHFPEHADGSILGNALWWHQKLAPHPLSSSQYKALARLQPLVDLWELSQPITH